jgi:hypothetical protein
MNEHVAVWPRLWLAAVVVAVATLSTLSARADEDAQIRRGFEIVGEIFPRGIRDLNLVGKDRELVGLGSYVVNTTGCNDCHTYPNWAPGGNPFAHEPKQINTAGYLAGGRPFVPPGVVSANITPDKPGPKGRPAGLTRDQFLQVMRTGHDPDDPSGQLLQVMPWPLYQWKTNLELLAMYEYLSAIPSVGWPKPGS